MAWKISLVGRDVSPWLKLVTLRRIHRRSKKTKTGKALMNYLCSYRPIILSKQGQLALKEFGFPPFIDGSCRREPDLESKYPSISALCRSGNFAPKLDIGDKVAYITTKGRYPGLEASHWRLVAILEVIRRFPSHQLAAEWYRKENLSIPHNCLVMGNEPMPLKMTSGLPSSNSKRRMGKLSDEKIIQLWDAGYQKRASLHSVFLASKPIFIELYKPPIITIELMEDIFGRIPVTQNPPKISGLELDKLKRLTKVL